jgi:hypothetical protein
VDTVDEVEYETDMSGFAPMHNAECDSTSFNLSDHWKKYTIIVQVIEFLALIHKCWMW